MQLTRRYFVGLIVVTLLVTLRLGLEQDPLRDWLQTTSAPISKWVADMRGDRPLAQNPQTLLQNSANEQLTQLQQELKLSGRGDSTITAGVTKRTVSGLRKSLTIEQGRADGVSLGDPVLLGGFLIGVIEEVFEVNSVVKLINDPTFRVTAIAEGAQGVIGIQRGSLVLDLVPDNDLKGSVVESSGIDGSFPPGLAIGEVAEEIPNGSDSFARYFVDIPYNPAETNYVTVMIGASS